jgi:hypothetical protein
MTRRSSPSGHAWTIPPSAAKSARRRSVPPHSSFWFRAPRSNSPELAQAKDNPHSVDDAATSPCSLARRAGGEWRSRMWGVAPMRWWIALVIGLSTMPQATQIQGLETATQMQSWCASFEETKVDASQPLVLQTPQAELCWGAFASIQELSSLVDQDGKSLLETCPSPSSTRTEYIRIFLHYTARHPEEGEMDFAGVARRALAETFPCPSN